MHGPIVLPTVMYPKIQIITNVNKTKGNFEDENDQKGKTSDVEDEND